MQRKSYCVSSGQKGTLNSIENNANGGIVIVRRGSDTEY